MSENREDYDTDGYDELSPEAARKMRRRFAVPQIQQFSMPCPVQWLWQDRIPLERVTLIEGPPGVGKSFVALDLAARVSRGAPWPDEPPPADPHQAPHPPADVLVLFRQDNYFDTVSSRLERMGGDPEHLYWFDGFEVCEPQFEREEFSPFSFPYDLPALEQALDERKTTTLVVIDSLSDYCRRPDQLEETLHQLNALAIRESVAIVATLSATCRTDSNGRLRTTSKWPTDAARCTWCVAPDPEKESRRLFVPTRMNFCAEPSGMAFEIQDNVIAWDSTRHVNVTDPVRSLTERETWLLALLADGAMPATVVYRDGQECGYTADMLRVSAKKLGIKRRKIGFGKSGYWEWSLAQSLDCPEAGSPTKNLNLGSAGPTVCDLTNMHKRNGRNGHMEEYPVFTRLSDLISSEPLAAADAGALAEEAEPSALATCGNRSSN